MSNQDLLNIRHMALQMDLKLLAGQFGGAEADEMRVADLAIDEGESPLFKLLC